MLFVIVLISETERFVIFLRFLDKVLSASFALHGESNMKPTEESNAFPF